MPEPTESGVNVFQESHALTLTPSNPLAMPVFQATSEHPWRIEAGELVLAIGTRSEAFTAEAVVLAAKRRMFGLSESWADPKFLKTVKTTDAGAVVLNSKGKPIGVKAKVGKGKKAKAVEVAASGEEPG